MRPDLEVGGPLFESWSLVSWGNPEMDRLVWSLALTHIEVSSDTKDHEEQV